MSKVATKSTFFRIFYAIASLLLISFLTLALFFGLIAYRTNYATMLENLEHSVDEISQRTTDLLSNPMASDRTLYGYLSLANSVTGHHILICDTSGRVFISSDNVNETYNSVAVGASVMDGLLISGRYTGVGDLGGLYLSEYVSVGRTISSDNGEVACVIFVSSELGSIRSMIRQFLRTFLLLAFGVLCLASVWAYFYARQFTRPIKRMAEVSRSFARGSFSARVDENIPEQEIHDLAVAFNNMADTLTRSEERRREFIASISHELKTPMTSIGGYVDGILDGVIQEGRRDEFLRVVSSEIKRLSRLVSQMLEISRVESEESYNERFSDFDLCELARQVLLGQEKKITDRGLDVDVKFDDAITVRADIDGITRVIYNLLDNAIKYSDANSLITLDIVKKGDHALFSVSDNGKPIPPEELELIFQRFHKTDRSRKGDGLGLGLYLVKQILARHGEDVWCTSDAGLTTMYFTLPLVQKKQIKSEN